MLGKVKVILQERINRKNRSKLTNLSPSLVCSNCTGGFLYHFQQQLLSFLLMQALRHSGTFQRFRHLQPQMGSRF